MEVRHIYWFAPFGGWSPSVRYRGKYPLEALKTKHRITYSFVKPGLGVKTLMNFIAVYCSALFFRRKNSVIVIQRVYTKRLYAAALKFLVAIRKKNTLYDIDDAEYLMHPPETVHYFMKHCAACAVGSAALMEYASKFNPCTFLLTSPVTGHGLRKKERNSLLTVGWIGCYWGLQRENLFSLFFPAIREADFPVRLIILGAPFKELQDELREYFNPNPNVILEIPGDLDWNNEQQIYGRILQFDIGISALTNHPINLAKSAYKMKQCLSAGIPVLASRVGENIRFLDPGVNGFFCDAPADFLDMVKRMGRMSSGEYESMSAKAAEGSRNYDLEHYCSTLLNFYRSY